MADDQDVACLRRFYSARPAPTPPCDGTLTVVVIRCSNLLAADSNGKSDPFVTLLLSGSEKVQTRVLNKTLDPVFNEKFEMQVEAESAAKDGRLELVITAIDKDTVAADDFLGDVVVDVWALLGEAEGEWTGTVQVPKTFAFGDSSGKLGRDEKKDLQKRRRSGTADPYGTIELIIGFQAQGDKWVAEAATWTDAQWEEKCSKIIGTYRKKAEKNFIHDRIIEKERSAGVLAEDGVEARRNELGEMKKKKREKLMSELGVAAISDSDEAALVSELRELMYSTIAKKYSLDPREMTGAQDLAAATTQMDGVSEHLQAEQYDVSDQQAKAAEAAKVATELEEQVAEAKEAVEIASATELAIAEEQHRKVEAAEEETAAAAAEEAKAAALAAAARAGVEEANRLASEAANEAMEASAAVEIETPVAAETIVEAAPQQQKDEAEASAERAQAKEEVPAAARGARALETIETPAEHQQAHAVETRPEEDAQEEGTQAVKGGASSQRDVDAMMAEGKALANAVVEQQARQWINAVRASQSQEPIQADADLADALRSGVILCELLNAIRPEAVVKPSKFSNTVHHRENIGKFVTGCTALGVPDAESFETVDLYEGSNLPQVWRCVASLGKHTPKSYTGPAMPSAATIRAEVNKAAADARAQRAAKEEEGEDGAAAQACADEEAATASAPEPAPPQQSTAEPVEDEGKGLADEAETEQVAAAGDEKTRLLDNDDAAAISEGVPPPQQERKRWWCCAASKPATYAPMAGTEDA